MKKKVLSLVSILCMALSITACGTGSTNVKEQTKNNYSIDENEPSEEKTYFIEEYEPDGTIKKITFNSIEEMEAYYGGEITLIDINEEDYGVKLSFVDEEFLAKEPLEQFKIYTEEINSGKYGNPEKYEIASRISKIYNETTNEEVIEKMDSIIRRKLFKDGNLLEYFPELNDNEKLVLIAIENGGYMLFASDRLQHDKDFLRKALDRHESGVLGCIEKDILTDKEFCIYMFKQGYFEVYNRLLHEASYYNDEKAKELIKDEEIITEIYKSMEVMEFEDMKELDEYVKNPKLLEDKLFGLFGEDFKAKRWKYVLEFREKNKDLEKIN